MAKRKQRGKINKIDLVKTSHKKTRLQKIEIVSRCCMEIAKNINYSHWTLVIMITADLEWGPAVECLWRYSGHAASVLVELLVVLEAQMTVAPKRGRFPSCANIFLLNSAPWRDFPCESSSHETGCCFAERP